MDVVTEERSIMQTFMWACIIDGTVISLRTKWEWLNMKMQCAN